MLTRISFSVSRHDHAETAASDVLHPQVESTEAVSDDEEETERACRVLELREESRVEAERERDLRRRKQVRLEDRLVERDERLEDLSVVLVHDVLLDVSAQLIFVEDLGRLQAGVREGRHELVAERRVVVGHRERNVEQSDLRAEGAKSVAACETALV